MPWPGGKTVYYIGRKLEAVQYIGWKENFWELAEQWLGGNPWRDGLVKVGRKNIGEYVIFGTKAMESTECSE